MTSLSSVFFGTPDFALSSLEAALKTTRVLAVITQPDRPRGRGQKLSPCPVKALATAKGIRCFSPASLKKPSPELDELTAWMAQSERPDVLLVTAYGNILPQSILDWPKIAPINVHASLLPRWRGAAPIQRALESGDPITGVSLQKIVFELDAGDILSEGTLLIAPDANAESLSLELSALGGHLLEDYITGLSGGTINGRPQELTKVTFAKKITKEEGFYSPKWTAHELHNRVRAFSVWPGVKADFNGSIIKLVETSLAPPTDALKTLLSSAVGSVSLLNSKIFLRTYNDVRASEPLLLELKKVQFPAKPVTPAVDALRNFFSEKPTQLLKAPTI